MNHLIHIFCNPRLSKYSITYLLVSGLGLWTGFSTAAAITSSRFSESDEVFQGLAALELSSNRLIMTIAEIDVVGFSHLLQQKPDFAGFLTSFEPETSRQSFVRSLRIMLDDETTAKHMKTHLAQFYASTLTPTEAQALTANYENEVIKDSSGLQELRHMFIVDHVGVRTTDEHHGLRRPRASLGATFHLRQYAGRPARGNRGAQLRCAYHAHWSDANLRRVQSSVSATHFDRRWS